MATLGGSPPGWARARGAGATGRGQVGQVEDPDDLGQPRRAGSGRRPRGPPGAAARRPGRRARPPSARRPGPSAARRCGRRRPRSASAPPTRAGRPSPGRSPRSPRARPGRPRRRVRRPRGRGPGPPAAPRVPRSGRAASGPGRRPATTGSPGAQPQDLGQVVGVVGRRASGCVEVGHEDHGRRRRRRRRPDATGPASGTGPTPRQPKAERRRAMRPSSGGDDLLRPLGRQAGGAAPPGSWSARSGCPPRRGRRGRPGPGPGRGGRPGPGA